MNILYIHGFNSSSQAGTLRRLRDLYPEHCWFGADFDLVDVEATRAKIRGEVAAHNIELFVASSLGGFYALLEAGVTPGMKCAVINPCMKPSYEIPKLDASVDPAVLSYWAGFESEIEHTPVEAGVPRWFGVFGDHDELFSYKPLFDSVFGDTSASDGKVSNSVMVDGSHHGIAAEVLKLAFDQAFAYFA